MAENGDVSFAPKAIGIDLGTTYSCIGVWRNDEREVEIIRNEQGNRTTPCMVAFLAEENLVGQSAMNQVFHNPHNTVFDVKRFIGRRYSDEVVQNNKSLWPFKVVSGPKDEPLIEIRYQGSKKTFRPEEISSMLLKQLKLSAEEFLECAVNKAVITVPAYFSNSQRQATRDAGNLAGLDVLQLLNEPTAAAIAYSIISRSQIQTHIPNEKILVYDLGGGTFDIAVLEIMNAQKEIAVKAVKGDTHLGGQDFDNRLLEFLLAEFQSKNNVNISGNAKASRRLRSACERAKRELSHARSSTIDIPCLYQSIDFFYTISRTKFEELNIDLFQRTIDLVADCIQDANLDETQIDSVVLVGGSSRIPKLEQLLKDFFAKNQSVKIHKHINPDEAVAYGAAVKAAQLNGDILDLDLDLCQDPCWAAICCSRDVTPLSIGIMTRRDVMSVMIPRKSPIPVKRERFVRTVKDNQSTMRLDFYKGERANVKDNSFLGGLTFGGIPPQPKGVEGLFLCLEIDKDGIVHGSVENSSTGRSRDFCFRSRFEEDFETKVVQKAEAFRSQDEVWKEIAVLKITIDDEIDDHRKRLDEFKGVISSREKKFQADFANELEKWVAGNANADVHKLKEKLRILKANQERLSAAIKGEQKKHKLFRCIRSPMH